MIAIAGSPKAKTASCGPHDQFLNLLPEIQKQACFAFRRLRTEARDELVQEVIATTYSLFASLCQRGKGAAVYPTPLTQFSIRKVRAGRRIGSRRNKRDVMAPHGRPTQGIVMERLDRFNRRTGQWREALIEDRRSTPAEIAAMRIDFACWLQTLSARDRRLAETLAAGETTSQVARLFRISAAERVSQLRVALRDNWFEFVGELADASGPSVATA